MAEQQKKYASGFVKPSDGETYYFQDDEARAMIKSLQEEIEELKKINVLILKQSE